VYLWHKATATIVLIFFTFFNILEYAPQARAQGLSAQAERLAQSPISIPEELGTIEESHQGSSQKTILYIQDAHDSLRDKHDCEEQN